MRNEVLNFFSGRLIEDTEKPTSGCNNPAGDRPAIADICVKVGWRCKHNDLERRSDMNDADDPGSSNARAFTEMPSWENTRSWQVMSREVDFTPAAVFNEIGVVLMLLGWGVLSEELECRRVCCGHWHSLHLCNDLQFLEKCPDLKQLRGRVHLFWQIYTVFVSSIKCILTKLCTRTKVCSNCLHKFDVLCMFGPFLIYLCIVMICF